MSEILDIKTQNNIAIEAISIIAAEKTFIPQERIDTLANLAGVCNFLKATLMDMAESGELGEKAADEMEKEK